MAAFKFYVREDIMGGEVFIEHHFDTATEAESAAFRMIAEDLNEYSGMTITPDGPFGDGIEEAWGGEFVMSHPSWDDDTRLVFTTED